MLIPFRMLECFIAIKCMTDKNCRREDEKKEEMDVPFNWYTGSGNTAFHEVIVTSIL